MSDLSSTRLIEVRACEHDAMHAELVRLRALNAELRMALEPFVRVAAIMQLLGLDPQTPLRDCAPGVWPTLADCQAARAALAKADAV